MIPIFYSSQNPVSVTKVGKQLLNGGVSFSTFFQISSSRLSLTIALRYPSLRHLIIARLEGGSVRIPIIGKGTILVTFTSFVTIFGYFSVVTEASG